MASFTEILRRLEQGPRRNLEGFKKKELLEARGEGRSLQYRIPETAAEFRAYNSGGLVMMVIHAIFRRREENQGVIEDYGRPKAAQRVRGKKMSRRRA